MAVFTSGLILALIVGIGLAILVGSAQLCYWIFMGDDPWEGRFRFATGWYIVCSFALTGIGWSAFAGVLSLWLR